MLPIEDYPNLLKEYGRALAAINLVEYSLKYFILVKGKLLAADHELTDKILDEMMLGKKISLAEQFLPTKVVSKLRKLSDYRILLAHGVTGEKAPINNPTLRTGKLFIDHKKRSVPFDEALLKKIYNLASKLSDELRVSIGTHFVSKNKSKDDKTSKRSKTL